MIENCLTMSRQLARGKYIRSPIGANGAGKSTFKNFSWRYWNQQLVIFPLALMNVCLFCRSKITFDYEDERVIDVVIMGNEKFLAIVMKEKMLSTWKKISLMKMVSAAELGEFCRTWWMGSRKVSISIASKSKYFSEDLHYQTMSDSQWDKAP